MHALILAGGFATRLWPLTEKRAKPLLPLAGTPIISHLLETIPTDIPVSVSTNAAFGSDFEEWNTQQSRERLDIAVEHTKSDNEKLGALGAIAQWLDESGVEDDLLLLLGDNLLGFDLHTFIQAFDGNSPLLAVHDIEDLEKARAFGTVIVEDASKSISRVTDFEEKPANPKSTFISTGCAILPASSLTILREYAKSHPDNVGGIFEEFLRKGLSVQAFSTKDLWFDIGSFDAYIDATKLITENSPQVHKEARVSDTDMEGCVVIGSGSVVEQSKLLDTVIFDGCIVEDCILERCIIDQGSVLRGIDLRGKMIREGTVLERSK